MQGLRSDADIRYQSSDQISCIDLDPSARHSVTSLYPVLPDTIAGVYRICRRMTGLELDSGYGYYLRHTDEEQCHHLTKSFWFGKFLQSLPYNVLHECRHYAQTLPPHKHTSPVVDTKRTESETPIVLQQVYNPNCVIFQTIGKDPLWVHVQKADECMRQSSLRASEHSSTLSPMVYRLVVESMSMPVSSTVGPATEPGQESLLTGVLREDLTLDWSKVATYLGSGM